MKALAVRIAHRQGSKSAKVALAGKTAVVLQESGPMEPNSGTAAA